MALLMLDSFDHYTDSTDKYLVGTANGTVASGRHGRGMASAFRAALLPNSPRFLVGFAFNIGAPPNTLVNVADGGSMFSLLTTNRGSIQVTIFGGNVAETIPDIVRTFQWHFLEAAGTFSVTTTGSGTSQTWTYSLSNVQVILDGTLVLNIPGLMGASLATTGAPTPNLWSTVGMLSNFFGVIDDFYVADGSGSAPWNALVGDIRVDVIRPNAPGAVADWTPVGGVPNWDANNDVNPDDEVTYVTADVAGKSDLYNMEDVGTGDTVIGAQILTNARRTEEGIGKQANLIRHAGVTTELPMVTLSPTYFYRARDCFDKMPNGDPLTDANLNAIQAGFRRTL